MPSYCCFFDPIADSSEKSLDDACPVCGRKYSFPLEYRPKKIGGIEIIESLNRGFYGAAYVGTKPPFGAKVVVKVVPKGLYEFFEKDFENEAKNHHELAQNTQHIVNIEDFGSDLIEFGNEKLDCHYAILEYAEGETLQSILDSDRSIPARRIAQIALDLYQILDELTRKSKYHNDLHAGNLIVQNLPESSARSQAVDDSVLVRAIDMGSAAPDSMSDPGMARIGDLRRVVSHIRELSQRLMREPESRSDSEFRLAGLIFEHCGYLDHSPTNLRVPNFEELRQQIFETVIQPVDAPWRQPLSLRRFDDSYNAQTLYSWHVPSLFVDPGEGWLNSITSKGPTIITGMRGCGKTILLRSADFHARATTANNSDRDNPLSVLAKDEFFGLYCSATRIIDSREKKFEKLFVAYVRAGITALMHLKDLNGSNISPAASESLAKFVSAQLGIPLEKLSFISLGALDRSLLRHFIEIGTERSSAALAGHPASAFEALATELRSCSESWSNQTLLYLLDDVSTRYLDESEVGELVSELMFSSAVCAFKFTTEAQTLELIVRAPGQVSPAWAGRDYEVFDLGHEVGKKLKERGGKNAFLVSILRQRASHYRLHPIYSPKDILGDTPLERIAKSIAGSSESSVQRKSVYFGLSALSGVCVGDLGDAISLYDEIIRRGGGKSPVEAKVQTECFQSHCSRRLYDLSRRKSELKSFALEFSTASRKLLVESKSGSSGRLRQYTQVYVRITSGDQERQFRKLRELLDCGVFVLEGGTGGPRTKTRDTDPVTQFKLRFRKLLGLSNSIPLGDRDRFELSGQELEDWLSLPEKGAEILMRNLSTAIEDAESELDTEDSSKVGNENGPSATQDLLNLGSKSDSPVSQVDSDESKGLPGQWIHSRVPSFEAVGIQELKGHQSRTCVLGLGFEDRCYEAIVEWLPVFQPETAFCVRYPEAGNSDAILSLLRRQNVTVRLIDHQEAPGQFEELITGGSGLIDVSGLSTPNIFAAVRASVGICESLFFAHGSAESYYPTNNDIQDILDADADADAAALLETLGKVWSGEAKPYLLESLLKTEGDKMAERALCAFAAAKHERLLTLLDKRDFDAIYIATPKAGTARSHLARLAAEVASKEMDRSRIDEVDTSTYGDIAEWLIDSYNSLFMNEGCNVEVGLTGSKAQTVVTAALSKFLKFGVCWYVRPSKFDSERFTQGFSGVKYSRLNLP